MHWVYVLWSSKLQKRYVGASENVKKRLGEHNRGCNKFTKGGIPWKLIYEESFSSKQVALKREKFLKSGQGRAWLDQKFPQFRKGARVV